MVDLIKEVEYDLDLQDLKNLVEDFFSNDFVIRFKGVALQHRNGVAYPWSLVDGLENLKNYNNVNEKDFAVINEFFCNRSVEKIINHFSLYRTRIMKLEGRSCYSIHKDQTWRLHIPIQTNSNCFFYFPKYKQDFYLEQGKVYLVNTSELHTFVNTDLTERYHLLGCIDTF